MVPPISQRLTGVLKLFGTSKKVFHPANTNDSVILSFQIHYLAPKSSMTLSMSLCFSSLSSPRSGIWNLRYNELLSQAHKSIPKKNATIFDKIIATDDKDEELILGLSKSTDPSLIKWIYAQRVKYRKQNKLLGKYLSYEKIELLNDINFIWDVKECIWNIRLRELEEFKRTHGHCLVPRNDKHFPKLKKWVNDTRKRRSNRNCKRSLLSEKQIQDLDNLGFIWNALDSVWYEKFL